jgi:hypothetical protein
VKAWLLAVRVAMLTVVVGLLVSRATGCKAAPRDEYEVHIDPALTDVEGMIDATADWATKTGVAWRIAVTPDGCSGGGCIEIHEVADEAALQVVCGNITTSETLG